MWELRRWKEQFGKVAVLIVGFSLLCTLLSFAVTSGKELFNGKPIWIDGTKNYATITNQHANGELSPVNKLTLLAAQQQPYVNHVAWFSINSYEVTFNGTKSLKTNSLWFSENIVRFLNIDKQLKKRMQSERGVWLSHQFWLEHFNGKQDIVGSVVSNSRLPQGIIVRGILPKKLNKIGTWSPDIWLTGSYLNYKTPFSSESMVDKFLLAAPLYYGIAETQKTINTDSLYNSLKSKDLTISSMQISGDGSSLRVYEQINFEPQSRESLYFQFQLLLLLVTSLAIVLSMNTFTLYSAQMIIHREEYRLQRILGANPVTIWVGPCLITVLFVLSILLLSSPMIWLLNDFIASQSLYSEAITKRLYISLSHQFSSLMLVSLLFFISVGVNFIPSFSGTLFSRAMNASNSRIERFVSQSLLTIQFTIAITALSLLTSLYLGVISNSEKSLIHEKILTLTVNLNGQYIRPQDIIEGNGYNVERQAIALSKNRFNKPEHVAIELPSSNKSAIVKVHHVSRNYFDTLGIDVTGVNANEWRNGVIINSLANETLKTSSNTDYNIGKTLSLGIEEASYRIEGIVDNLPHFGVYGGEQASIYIIFDDTTNQNIHFYTRAQNETSLQHLKSQLTNSSARTEVIQESMLADIIAKTDALHLYMLSVSTVLVSIIVLSVLLSLNYQLKARLKLEQQKLGVLLAVGAPRHEIMKIFIVGFSLPLIFAVPLALLSTSSVEQLMSEYSTKIGVIDFYSMIFSVTILVLLLALIASLQALKLLKTPIYSLLRSN